ncbi:Glycerophosphoryl diester phosphodiesterase family-domain-containing protein [Cladochytrium replicatum]|nr:Glycerophosphoryl diester phosphodiesterase family-domain-containing protein [Cladochytrium replicatum]
MPPTILGDVPSPPASTAVLVLTIGCRDARKGWKPLEYLSGPSGNPDSLIVSIPGVQISETLDLGDDDIQLQEFILSDTERIKISLNHSKSGEWACGEIHVPTIALERLWMDQPGAHKCGRGRIPLYSVSDRETVAIFTFELVTIAPYKGFASRAKTVWAAGQRGTQVVGHRGLGKNRTFQEYSKLTIGENTTLSMDTAFKFGASFVEFDVQLTKDKVPVIYHDWTMNESTYEVAVNQLTLKEFLAQHPSLHPDRRLSTALQHRRAPRSSSSDRHSSIFSEDSGISATRDPSNPKKWPWKGNYDGTIQDVFTTLENAFETLPPKLGFNIEVKYPLLEEAEADNLHMLDLNAYIDAILEIVHRAGGRREIIFSSFHPEACLLLHYKQSNHPVLFLSCTGEEIVASDRRTDGKQHTLRFIEEWSLNGGVFFSRPFFKDSETGEWLARWIRSEMDTGGKLMLTWGGDNNDPEKAKRQREWGFDGVILDSLFWVAINTLKMTLETSWKLSIQAISSSEWDVTGPIGEQALFVGYADLSNQANRIHLSVLARVEPSRRMVYISSDSGSCSVRTKKLAISNLSSRLSDSEAALCSIENVLVSSTHTHSGPGGFQDDLSAYPQSLHNCISNHREICERVPDSFLGTHTRFPRSHRQRARRGHRPSPRRSLRGQSRLHQGPSHQRLHQPLKSASYLAKPASERAQDTDVDQDMTLLAIPTPDGFDERFERTTGFQAITMGYASHRYELKERLLGNTLFVAAFGQSNAGDVSRYTNGAHSTDIGAECDRSKEFLWWQDRALSLEGSKARGDNRSTEVIGERQ